jgi:serine/threonine-protein kinase
MPGKPPPRAPPARKPPRSGVPETTTPAAPAAQIRRDMREEQENLPRTAEIRGKFGDTDEDDEPLDMLVGQTILGQYEIVKKIGDGGFGSVYLANQLGVSRRAVVKVVNTTTDEDSQVVLKRFQREATVLGALDNSHLVRLYNFGSLEDGRPFLAMEYGGDVTVAEEMKKLRKMKPERALQIGEQVCEALDEAHRRGIIHRDLKPQNIMLSRKEGADWVKVVDVGIAKIMDVSDVDPDGHKLTGTGMVIGTPAYFSPEQCHGVGMDGRSDLYTLAVVLYEMIAGQLPLKGLSPVDYVRAHVVDPPVPLRKHVPTLPPFVESAIMKALNKKADQRYANAMEMREALRSARERMRTQGPQRKQRIAMVATASAVILLGLGAVLWLAARQDRDSVDVEVSAVTARSERGTLEISVKPENAVVILDGKPVSAGRMRVAPGKHTISARAEGCEETSETFEVRPRQSLPVNLSLVCQ